MSGRWEPGGRKYIREDGLAIVEFIDGPKPFRLTAPGKMDGCKDFDWLADAMAEAEARWPAPPREIVTEPVPPHWSLSCPGQWMRNDGKVGIVQTGGGFSSFPFKLYVQAPESRGARFVTLEQAMECADKYWPPEGG
jgi:hypothetical protein